MVDAHVSGTCPARDGGSSPLLGTGKFDRDLFCDILRPS